MKLKDIRLTLLNFNTFHKIVDLINLLFVMYLSFNLLSSPLYGTLVYILGSFFTLFINMFLKRKQNYYSKGTLVYLFVLLGTTVLINNVLLIIFADTFKSLEFLMITGLTIILLLRNIIPSFILSKVKDSYKLRIWVSALIHFIFLSCITIYLYFIVKFDSIIVSVVLNIISSFILCTNELRIKKEDNTKKDNTLEDIYSYKTFTNMAFYSYSGFYLSVLLYIIFIFIRFEEYESYFYLLVGLWFLIILIVTFVAYRLLINKSKGYYGATFVLGAVIWSVSIIILYNTNSFTLWWSLMWSFGSAMMFAVVSCIQEKFKLVSKVIDAEVDDDILMQNTIVTHNVSLFTCEFLALIASGLFAIYASNMDKGILRLVIALIMVLPIIFIFVAMIFTLRQPLDKDTSIRLDRLNHNEGNIELKTKLDKMLVKKYRRRIGVRIIMFFVRIFYHHRVYGEENVDKKDLPAIFVCNHGEAYGPVVAVAYLPFYFRPWIESQLLDPEKGYPYTYKYTFSQIRWLPVFMRKFLAKISVKIAAWGFNSFDPIPVYRSELRSIFKTFDISVKALKEDDNILLFPESTHNTEDGKYAKGGAIGDFYTGFAHIGVKYYQETQKTVTFYPIYANKKKRKFIIGEGIKYNPENERNVEKVRIANELRSAMEELKNK